MDQKELRDRLIAVVEAGLTSKSVAFKTGIATDILSRFKNGRVCLCENDAVKLFSYLDRVVIP